MAQLERLAHVREVRVNWTGRFFLLTVDSPQNFSLVTEATLSTLGKGSRRVSQSEEQEQLQTFHRGEPWLKSGETLRMSEEERRVLAERFASRAAKDTDLDDRQKARLHSAISKELQQRFEEAHRGTRSLNRFKEEWPALIERVIKQACSDMPVSQQEQIRVSLIRSLDR